MSAVTVDIAGASMGGAARYVAELRRYLADTCRRDVRIIGSAQQLSPRWLLRRESYNPGVTRRVAVNNVSFLVPGGPRWTLLGNALHFLSEDEASRLHPSLRSSWGLQARVVRGAALRSDVLIAPCTTMAERIIGVLPQVRRRVVVRLHPVSRDSIPIAERQPVIIVPILFAAYKQMPERLSELVAALDKSAIGARVRVTASAAEVGPALAANPRIDLLGHLSFAQLQEAWATSRAVYFPTTLESFGYPMAEARVSGRPVIACENGQSREVAGKSLCGFRLGDPSSLASAIEQAMTSAQLPEPEPFDPVAYFDWLLGRRA